MSVFVVGQISIHDRPTYDRYAARFTDVLSRYGGRLLAADEAPAVLEGVWGYQKVVLLQFPGREEFERWSQSVDYAELAKDRLASTTGCVLLVDGLSR
jgi:uncharacterized protein (DUF1330 family)